MYVTAIKTGSCTEAGIEEKAETFHFNTASTPVIFLQPVSHRVHTLRFLSRLKQAESGTNLLPPN